MSKCLNLLIVSENQYQTILIRFWLLSMLFVIIPSTVCKGVASSPSFLWVSVENGIPCSCRVEKSLIF